MTEIFAKETEKKLAEKMEATLENKQAQLLAKQERLKEHVSDLCDCSLLQLFVADLCLD